MYIVKELPLAELEGYLNTLDINERSLTALLDGSGSRSGYVVVVSQTTPKPEAKPPVKR